MSFKHRGSSWALAGVVLLAILGRASGVFAQVPPPHWSPLAYSAPAAGGALVIAGVLGYGIYRLRRRGK